MTKRKDSITFRGKPAREAFEAITKTKIVQPPTPKPAETAESYTIGVGVLNWSRHERVSDRYGTVTLNPVSGGYACADDRPEVKTAVTYQSITKAHDGEHGRLVATVLETRDSGHIGDLFHGISPRTPKVDQQIVLGEGTLFFESQEVPAVGLKPDTNRNSQWLSMRALYDCHDQTVRLDFQPTDRAK